MSHPPFRADQVGSLLRPGWLAENRKRWRCGEIDSATLRDLEDRAIRDCVAAQERIGLAAVTDGEFRRDWWHLDFLSGFEGVELRDNGGERFKVGDRHDEQPPIATVTDRIRCSKPIMAEDFAFLKSLTDRVPKMTIPSPSMLYLRGGRNAVSRDAYPDIDSFWADTAQAYRIAIRHLADAGCTYLQLDDVSFAYLCDEKVRSNCRDNGDDPDALPTIFANAINEALRDRPAAMTVTMHTCRGNFRSAWVAEGGYDPVAKAMFTADVDGFFMEFDNERAGGFGPLAHAPKDKRIVLGLVTTKAGALESADTLKRRIDEAAKIVPLENLCLSPQCGFSSTHHGNALTEVEQWKKLERVVEVARDVWGEL